MIVSDSSPIISLGKQGYLEIFNKCFNKVIIPKAVFKEVMEKEGSLESKSLEKAIVEKWVIVEDVDINSVINTENLGQGEKEAISLAKKLNVSLIIDDDNAKKYSSVLNVISHGSLFVIYLSVFKKFIDKEKAKKLFEEMIKEGFYVSTEIYVRFLELLDKI